MATSDLRTYLAAQENPSELLGRLLDFAASDGHLLRGPDGRPKPPPRTFLGESRIPGQPGVEFTFSRNSVPVAELRTLLEAQGLTVAAAGPRNGSEDHIILPDSSARRFIMATQPPADPFRGDPYRLIDLPNASPAPQAPAASPPNRPAIAPYAPAAPTQVPDTNHPSPSSHSGQAPTAPSLSLQQQDIINCLAPSQANIMAELMRRSPVSGPQNHMGDPLPPSAAACARPAPARGPASR